jgi:hypothetical protein
MSLDQLTSQITKLRTRAASLQDEWSRLIRNVGRDSRLTDEGKRVELDREFAAVKKELATLRDREKDLVRDQKESLERLLFGLNGSDPNKIIAYRDAQDRAARVKDKAAALEVYHSAQISNDDSLTKAILAKAVEYGYREIIDDYIRRHPTWGEELNDLVGIQRYSSDGNVGLQRTLAYAIVRGVATGDAADAFIDLSGRL